MIPTSRGSRSICITATSPTQPRSSASFRRRGRTRSTISRRNPCAGLVRDAGVHRQRRRTRDSALARGHPYPGPGGQDPLLSGLDLRAVRQGAGDPATGDHAILPALSLRGGQALRALDHDQLPRGLRLSRLQRYSFQPREPHPGRNLRHPEDHASGRVDRVRAATDAVPRQPRCHARLGTRPRRVEGMWLILQQSEPDDYVLATGETHSVREFVEKAFAHIGKPLVWRGRGVEEKGVDQSTGRVLVEVDPRYFRPTEVDSLLGDASKARAKLGWRQKTNFEQLVTEMVEADLVKIREERERRNRPTPESRGRYPRP